jgi:hypothetical protein
MAKNNPAPAETATREIAAHIGTAVGGVGKIMLAASDTSQPKNLPSIPSIAVSTTASVGI